MIKIKSHLKVKTKNRTNLPRITSLAIKAEL